jgi:hypothetical protein
MTEKFTRELTPTERAYIVNAEICPPFANQIIMEGTGVLDLKLWQKAMEVASAANPGSRLVLKGKLNFTRWVDSGKTPRVREVDGSKWDGNSPENDPCTSDPLDPYEGPAVELVLIHGDPLRVAIRAHHAVMDGRGTLNFLFAITQGVRGEVPISFNSKMTEIQLAKSFQQNGRTPPPHQYLSPTGKPSGDERGFTWRRVMFDIPKFPNAVGQLAIILAKEAWSHAEGPVRISIPVDMRARKTDVLSLGNLTNFMYTEIDKNTTPEDVTKNVKQQIAEKRDGELYWADSLVRFMPMSMIRKGLLNEIETKKKTGLYRSSAVISNMQEIPHKIFAGGGFVPNGGLGIPPCVDVIPFFGGMARNTELNKFVMIISVPKVLANNGRIDNLMKKIKEGMKPAPPK